MSKQSSVNTSQRTDDVSISEPSRIDTPRQPSDANTMGRPDGVNISKSSDARISNSSTANTSKPSSDTLTLQNHLMSVLQNISLILTFKENHLIPILRTNPTKLALQNHLTRKSQSHQVLIFKENHLVLVLKENRQTLTFQNHMMYMIKGNHPTHFLHQVLIKQNHLLHLKKILYTLLTAQNNLM
ncbi:hypothetical protein DYY67_1371 [Candidatus Nitrosotalea sp. TS]|nr:hypothetical protein [Candidatus Nitrosotalea sp. TS]